MFQNVPPCSYNINDVFSFFSEGNLNLKIFTSTIFMMMLLAPTGQLIYAQDTGNEGSDPINEFETTIEPLILEQIKWTAQFRFQEMYDLMFDISPKTENGASIYDGPVIPDDTNPAIKNMFMNSWQAMQQAKEKEQSDPNAAANSFMRAMKQLRNSFRIYQKDNPEVSEELALVEDELLQDEIQEEPTEEELTDTQQVLIQRFRERFQNRLTEMFQNYNSIEDKLSIDDAEKAFSALIKAEQRLLRIQERIQAREYDEVLEELEDTSVELEEDFDSMEDPATVQMFKTLNRLEEHIQRMLEQANRKAAKGENTSEIDAVLEELRGNKDKTKNSYKDSKGNNKDNSNNSNKGGTSGK